MVPPSEACLYGHINWSLAQAQQHSSIGLSQSFAPKRGGKARPQTVFHFTVQKRPVPESADTRKKGGCGVGTPDVSQSTASPSSWSSVLQLGMLSHIFDQCRSITSNRFVLNMFQGHHLQLRSHPPLFPNFWLFTLKAAAAHHPIIQKEVEELLAKGVIEPSSGGAGFYSRVFIVPKHTGGLWPTLYLKQVNHNLHIPCFKMPSIRHVQQLIEHGDYAFSLDLKKHINIFLLLSIIIIFLEFVWHNMPYQWKVLPLGHIP